MPIRSETPSDLKGREKQGSTPWRNGRPPSQEGGLLISAQLGPDLRLLKIGIRNQPSTGQLSAVAVVTDCALLAAVPLNMLRVMQTIHFQCRTR